MAKTVRNVVIFVLIAAIVAIVLSFGIFSTNYKGDSKQVMDHLGITATVQEDGTLTMQEEWTVTLENRDSPYRNIYKTIRLNSGDSIEGLTVYDMDHDISYELVSDINPYNPPDSLENACYYYQEGRTLEIGLFMPPIDSGTRHFRIEYRYPRCV